MKKQFRTAMLSTACMLIVAVMSLTGVTYAWFAQGTKATVSGMSMEVVSASGGIEISEDGSVWASELVLNSAINSVEPTSTTNAVDFVSLDRYNPADSTEMSVKVADESDYIVKELQIRNTGTKEIKIDFRNTYIKDKASATNNLTEIGKAARIAIFTGTKAADSNTITYTLVGIMAPYLTATAYGDVSEKYNAIMSGAVDAEGYFKFGAASGTYLTEIQTKTTNEIEITLPGTVDDEAQVVYVKVVAWLEGQDADCKTSNAGGAFDMFIQVNETNSAVANLVPTVDPDAGE